MQARAARDDEGLRDGDTPSGRAQGSGWGSISVGPKRPKPVVSSMLETPRAVAQLGSAPDWGSGGRRFKSCQPDSVMSQDIADSRTYEIVGPAVFYLRVGPGGRPVPW